jgi:hypothetical protein
MKTSHLSAWEQEEYLLAPHPEATQHLAQCAACQAGVDQLRQGVTLFRTSALEWSAMQQTSRVDSSRAAFSKPTLVSSGQASGHPSWQLTPALKWALAALLLLLALLPLSRSLLQKPLSTARTAPAAALTDDALLQQVDEQVSEAVPDSMESLTHLVTTHQVTTTPGAGSTAAATKSKAGGNDVQRN